MSPSRQAISAPMVSFLTDVSERSDGSSAKNSRIFLTMLALVTLWLVLLRVVPASSVILLALTFAVVALVCTYYWTRASASARRTARDLVLAKLPRTRVQCTGTVGRLAHMLDRGDIQDQMFEPFVCRAAGARPATFRRGLVQIIVGLTIAAMLVVLPQYFGFQIGTAASFAFPISIGGAMLAGDLAYPTYLRVVPGRIDVLEYGLFGREVEKLRRLDLREVAVTVDLRQEVVRIAALSGTKIVAFGGVRDHWGFAHAVLMAAVSTHTPPPLPDDALVG